MAGLKDILIKGIGFYLRKLVLCRQLLVLKPEEPEN